MVTYVLVTYGFMRGHVCVAGDPKGEQHCAVYVEIGCKPLRLIGCKGDARLIGCEMGSNTVLYTWYKEEMCSSR